jgi:hypothetical protein
MTISNVLPAKRALTRSTSRLSSLANGNGLKLLKRIGYSNIEIRRDDASAFFYEAGLNIDADGAPHFVVGQSATGQISHTKGFVADAKVGGEGSTNWSVSGEGTFVVKGQPGGRGYKAQNNTQSVFTDPDAIGRFQSELIAEHMAARVQKAGNAVEGAYKKGNK